MRLPTVLSTWILFVDQVALNINWLLIYLLLVLLNYFGTLHFSSTTKLSPATVRLSVLIELYIKKLKVNSVKERDIVQKIDLDLSNNLKSFKKYTRVVRIL